MRNVEYYCDRCKNKVNVTDLLQRVLFPSLNSSGFTKIKYYDICKKCSKDFKKWLKGVKK